MFFGLFWPASLVADVKQGSKSGQIRASSTWLSLIVKLVFWFLDSVRNDGRLMTVQKFLILAGGWILVVVGMLLTPVPLPFPFFMLALIGFAILVTHSKMFRRWIQHLRHRNSWISRGLEYVTTRAPAQVKAMVHRTRPHAVHRHARIRARRDET